MLTAAAAAMIDVDAIPITVNITGKTIAHITFINKN
jgi:hypothetical protein